MKRTLLIVFIILFALSVIFFIGYTLYKKGLIFAKKAYTEQVINIPTQFASQKTSSTNISDNFKFAVIGDTEQHSFQLVDGVLAQVEALNYPFAIQLGDIATAGAKADYDEYYNKVEKLNTPIYNVVGNQDVENNGIQYFKGKHYYSFDYNNSLFILLNDSNYKIDNDQMNWLRTELEKNYTNKFVIMHVPLYHNKYVPINPLLPAETVKTLEKLFKQHKVNTLFAGHLPGPFFAVEHDIRTIIMGSLGPAKSELYNYYMEVVVEDNNVSLKRVFIDTNLWILDDGLNEVQQIDKTGRFISKIDLKNLRVSNFTAAEIDKNSIWLASDLQKDKAVNIDANGKILNQFTINLFDEIEGIAIDNNTLWIVSDKDNKLYNFNKTGDLLKIIETNNNEMLSLEDITLDKTNDTLWLTDNGSNKIFNVDKNGKLLASFKPPINTNNLQGITVDKDSLWITIRDKNEIYKLDKEGQLLETIQINDTLTNVVDISLNN